MNPQLPQQRHAVETTSGLVGISKIADLSLDLKQQDIVAFRRDGGKMVSFSRSKRKFRAREQMTRAVGRFLYVMRHDGITVAARKALAAAHKKRSPPDAFDERFGVDTGTEVPLWKLRIPSRHVNAGNNYQTIGAEHIERLLLMLPCRPPLIDLGCGKGRVLIIAHRLGFRPVTGVEFSPDLVAIARRNLQICGIPGQVLCQDAADVDFPKDCVIFMYNPFDSEVMTHVAKKIRESAAHIYVVYVNAKCDHLFHGFHSIHQEPGTVACARPTSSYTMILANHQGIPNNNLL